MLSAVPVQTSPPRSAREEAFRRHVEGALASLAGPDAVSTIMQAYSADLHALSARADGSLREASDAAQKLRMHHQMLLQVQTAASQGIWERAKISAELATYKGIVDHVRHMADRADGTGIAPENISAALSVEPIESVHPSVTVAFVASDQFRGGQFVSTPEGDVTFVFTFIGWALVDHGPGALGCVEPMFLVEDRALPRSVIEHERFCRLEHYLPNLEPMRAA